MSSTKRTVAHHPRSELYFLLLFLSGIFVLTFFIFRPFLFALVLAMVFAAVFEPIHARILAFTRGKKALTALLTSVCVLVAVVAPVTFLGIQIFQESTGLYSHLVQNNAATGISGLVENAVESLNKFLPAQIQVSIDVNQYLKTGVSWLLQQIGPLFANVAQAAIGVFVFLIALYYLFKDGHQLRAALVNLSPLQDTHDEAILNKLGLAVNSVIKGSLIVAIVQGLMTTIGLLIFGVPNAALLGSVAAIAALIPGVGTSLVLIPAILYLFFTGATLPAIGLLLWGMTAVGLIDNFLGPVLVGRGTMLHPFLILLSILGGIAFFGPIGFLIGPLVLSLLFALIEIYFTILKEQGTEK